ncbi:hypothetical protein KPH14_002051 [Odynerus spinipes]|uniref:Reverse transcriptase Ty1/copia-type domain-containing protein n=1 Tax=Odynerus spinipes TaxID=1348599 RepID=A0AAD9REX7_9HYME|nr:hypothetical protein KPH14_002051 [Odynerus spinipes]
MASRKASTGCTGLTPKSKGTTPKRLSDPQAPGTSASAIEKGRDLPELDRERSSKEFRSMIADLGVNVDQTHGTDKVLDILGYADEISLGELGTLTNFPKPGRSEEMELKAPSSHEVNMSLGLVIDWYPYRGETSELGQATAKYLTYLGDAASRLTRKDTWELVDRPKNRSVIGCRMVLINKFEMDGSLCCRKARLVAKGFSQRPGIDFAQTFAPVARLGSLRLIMAIATKYKMIVHQLDIVTAYLNGYLDEEIFMEKPIFLEEALTEIYKRNGNRSDVGVKAKEMLEALSTGNKVCRLKRALYGLKQAGRQWYRRLDGVLRKLDLEPTKADTCLYFKREGKDCILALVYVDDILIASTSSKWIQNFKSKLGQEFDVKDLGCARYCLGIEINQTSDGVSLSQRRYIKGVLKRFGMSEANPAVTPGEANHNFSRTTKAEDKKRNSQSYQELIGALMYLAVATRPDIAFVVSYLGQFNHSHTEEHWGAAKRVLRYLQGTLNYTLSFRRTEDGIIGYSDADWGNCGIDRKSYTGYVFLLSGAAVSWKAQKQRTVALSSTEAEYIALAEAAKEAKYLRNLLMELGFCELAVVQLRCDNREAKALFENPVYHARTKHIDIRHHFIRDAIKENLFKLSTVPSGKMVADVFTKSLPKPKHYYCTESLGMVGN